MNSIIPQDATPLRQCNKCHQWKPETVQYFSPEKRCRGGLRTICRECRNAGLRKTPIPEVLPPGYKRCTKCKEVKPATIQHFHAEQHGRYGLRGVCKVCTLQALRKPKKPKDTTHKVCTKCKLRKPLEAFTKDPRGPLGRRSRCRLCDCETRNTRYHRKVGKQLAQLPLGLVRTCNRCKVEKPIDEFIVDRHRRDGCRGRCKECQKMYAREYVGAHRARVNERIRTRKRETYPQKREQERERARQRYSSNPVSYARIRERDGNFCYICEGVILPEHRTAFDHVIPLARGGEHTESNIRLTHFACNARKSDLPFDELTQFHRRGV